MEKKRVRSTGISAALAMAAAAFVSVPATGTAQTTTSGRRARRRRCAPASPQVEGGPYFAGRRATVRVGFWRPPQGSPCNAGVTVQVFDVESGDVLFTEDQGVSDGKGTTFEFDTAFESGKLVGVRTDVTPAPRFASKTPSNSNCEDTFPFRVSVQVSDGQGRQFESYPVWPVKW